MFLKKKENEKIKHTARLSDYTSVCSVATLIFSAAVILTAVISVLFCAALISFFGREYETLVSLISFILFIFILLIETALFNTVLLHYYNKKVKEPLVGIKNAIENSCARTSPSRDTGLRSDTALPDPDAGYPEEIRELITAVGKLTESVDSLEAMRSGFISAVSHDMRTPMTTISGFIDCILEGAIQPDRQEHYLRLIKSEVLRLSRLVSSLLDISRIQAGDRSFVMQRFNICETARLILLSFEQKIEEKKLDVDFSADEDDLYVTADSDGIYQVIYNIVDNAVKFSREKGRLSVSLTRDGGDILVSVMNEGEGISPEDQPYVFDRFFKADRTRGLDKGGSGLGMFISKTIIEAHGRRLQLESVPGSYARFYFSLPESVETDI